MRFINKGEKNTTRRKFFKDAAVGGAAIAAAIGGLETVPSQAAQAPKGSTPPPKTPAAQPRTIIDIYTHILPKRYLALYGKKNPKVLDTIEARSRACTDIDERLKLIDQSPGVIEVLTIANPPMDAMVSPSDAAELAQIANDELAELVAKYPNKFKAAVACVSMDNVDAALKEIDRAITKLGMKGIQTATRVHAEPLDIPKLKPIWEKMAKLDLPIWIHPYHNDKLDWDQGQLCWPFETSTAMYRLVNSGLFDEYPNIKFITHHLGGMIPYFYKRVPRQEVYRNFYGDTAVWGNIAAVMCGYAFFGADHVLFGSDGPFGRRQIQIDSVEWASIAETEKEKIFTGNALRLLKLNA